MADSRTVRLFSAVGAAAASLSLVALLWLGSALADLGESRRWVENTHQVLGAAEELRNALNEAETGQRGFLLTLDPHDLASYRSGADRATTAIAALFGLLSDNAAQSAREPELRRAVNARLAELARAVEAAQQPGGLARALDMVRTDEARPRMDELRAALATIEHEERELLDRRIAAIDRAAHHALAATMAAGAFALITTVATGRSLLANSRRRARAAESERDFGAIRLREFYADAPVALAFHDAQLRYVDLNQRMADFDGVAREAHLGRTPKEVVPAFAPALEPLLEQVRSTGEKLFDVELAPPGGAACDHLARLAPLRDATGTLLGINVAVVDVGELRRAERALRELTEQLEQRVEQRTRQLAENNEALEAFATAAAHDLRAPVRAMAGFGQALLEEHSERLDETALDYLGRIVAASQRMDMLIADLLAYARLGRKDIRLSSVSLQSCIDKAIAALRVGGQCAAPIIEIAQPLPQVRGYEPVLIQVIENMLANACKFVAPGEQATVRIHAERHDGAVRLWVEDRGIGIAPQFRRRVFEVFRRLHDSDTYPGSGVGLAIVRKGIERMGGRVGIESNLPSGSRFWIELEAV